MNKFTVFDNEGRTLDRYTIIDHATGNIYTSSINPFDPLGVGQLSCNAVEAEFPSHQAEWFDMSIGWWPKEIVSIAVKAYIYDARKTLRHGIPVSMEKLPPPVRRYISNITQDETQVAA